MSTTSACEEAVRDRQHATETASADDAACEDTGHVEDGEPVDAPVGDDFAVANGNNQTSLVPLQSVRANAAAVGCDAVPSAMPAHQNTVVRYRGTRFTDEDLLQNAVSLGLPDGWRACMYGLARSDGAGRNYMLFDPRGRRFKTLVSARQYIAYARAKPHRRLRSKTPLREVLRKHHPEATGSADVLGTRTGRLKKRGHSSWKATCIEEDDGIANVQPVSRPKGRGPSQHVQQETWRQTGQIVKQPLMSTGPHSQLPYLPPLSDSIAPGSEEERWVRNHPLYQKLLRGYPLPFGEQEILALRAYAPKEDGGTAELRNLGQH